MAAESGIKAGVPLAAGPVGIREQARRIITGRRWRAALALAGFCIVAGAIGLLLADGMLALPDALRVPAVPLVGLIAGGVLLILLASLNRFRPDEDQGLRLAERALDDRHRRLSTALQLSSMSGELAQAGAARLQRQLPSADLAQNLPKGRSKVWLLSLAGLALGLLLLHLLMPRFLGTVLPRFLDPQGDHPPFSLTQLSWSLAPERVRVGDPARFEISVQGPIDEFQLQAEPADGDGEQISVPLFQVGEGRYAAEIAAVAEPLTVWVSGAGTRTHYHNLATDLVPVLAQTDLTVIAPSYARLEDEQRRVKAGNQVQLELLPASRIVLRPQANRSIKQLSLIQGETRLELPLSDGRAEWQDPAPGAWQVVVTAADGVEGHPQALAVIDRREDQAPRVRIVQPGRDAMATPGMAVPIKLAADDDLGLVTVWRLRAYNQLGAPDLSADPEGRVYEFSGELKLAELGVKPGDLLTIGVLAKDSKPGAGQNSPTVQRHIRVISEEEYNRALRRRLRLSVLRRKYKPLFDEMKELRQRMRELAKKRGKMEKTAVDRELEKLAKQAKAIQDKVQKLHRKSPLFPLERDLQKQLGKAADRLAEAAADKERMEELAKQMEEMVEMMERDLELVEKIGKANALLARLRQIIDAQQNVAERLTPLAGHRRLNDADRVRLRELAQQEADLADAIDKWQELVPKVQDELLAVPGGEEPAQQLGELARALRDTDAQTLMRHAAAAARAADGTEAKRQADEARDRLLALLPNCQQCQGAAEAAGMGLSWGNLGDLLATLRAMGAMGMGGGMGMGGVGMGGLGFALGYGGDDMAGSMPGAGMDLFGPEQFGQEGGESQGGDGSGRVAGLAASGSGDLHQATGYERAVRGSRTTTGVALSDDQQALVDDYFRQLEAER